MTAPLVSVITPVFNAARFLRVCIDSVRKQTFGDWEHVLADDGSTDESPEIIRQAAAKDHRIRLLLTGKRCGPAKARNCALEKARGRYVAFLDADDLWLPTKLERCLASKRYVSYIGTICRAHEFDQFIDFMRDYLAHDPDVRFRVASMRELPRYVLRDPMISRHRARVETCCGRPLQTEEINRCYSESLCVWNVYRRSTQSGVLPKALMFGTPVLISQTGSFAEFVEDGVHGRFVSAQDHTAIRYAIDDIRERIAEYACNCRAKFTGTFFYRSKLADLERLL